MGRTIPASLSASPAYTDTKLKFDMRNWFTATGGNYFGKAGLQEAIEGAKDLDA
jgi:hypothetical protein